MQIAGPNNNCVFFLNLLFIGTMDLYLLCDEEITDPKAR